MRSGDLTARGRLAVDRAIRAAETHTRFEFSVYVGPTESTPQDYSERMHAVLAAPDRTVMVMVDPHKRVVYATTGREVRARISNDLLQYLVHDLAKDLAAGEDGDAIARFVTAVATAVEPAGVNA